MRTAKRTNAQTQPDGSGTQFCVVVLAWKPNADLKRSGKSAFEIERIMSEGNFRVKFFLRSSHKKSDRGKLRDFWTCDFCACEMRSRATPQFKSLADQPSYDG